MMEFIDVMTKLWGTIDDGKGGHVLSYSALDTNNFPKKIEKFPSVITYVNDMEPAYSTSSPFTLKWTGFSEFHIMPNLSLEGIPVVQRFFKSILVIAAGNMKLKNTCTYWKIQPPDGGIHHVHLEFAEGPAHRGILVNWTVEEDVTGKIPVSA